MAKDRTGDDPKIEPLLLRGVRAGDLAAGMIVKVPHFATVAAAVTVADWPDTYEVTHLEPRNADEILVVFAGGYSLAFDVTDPVRVLPDKSADEFRTARVAEQRRLQAVAGIARLHALLAGGTLSVPSAGFSVVGYVDTDEALDDAARALGVSTEDRPGGSGRQVMWRSGPVTVAIYGPTG